MKDLEKAISLLQSGGYTCVLCKDDSVITSTRRGVAPLLELLDSGRCVAGFCAADKVVGKATAMLYCLLQVQAVYAAVMSIPAARVLKNAGIPHSYGQLVDHIVNRTGDGTCPMEAATAQAATPQEALAAVRAKLKELRQ